MQRFASVVVAALSCPYPLSPADGALAGCGSESDGDDGDQSPSQWAPELSTSCVRFS